MSRHSKVENIMLDSMAIDRRQTWYLSPRDRRSYLWWCTVYAVSGCKGGKRVLSGFGGHGY